jgi:threonine dehydratase
MKHFISFSSFQKAAEHLKGVINLVHLRYSECLGQENSTQVYIKPECLQHTGALSIAGLSQLDLKGKKVVSVVSGGNIDIVFQTLADYKANVTKLDHNQSQNPERFKSLTLDVTLETNGRQHDKRIVSALNSQGYKIETGF